MDFKTFKADIEQICFWMRESNIRKTGTTHCLYKKIINESKLI